MARCWGFLLLASALAVCSSSQSAASHGPSSAFVLSNSTVAPLLKQLGTSKKEVLFTTFQIDKDRAILYMLRNFVYWIQKAGMLKHALLITHDEASWRTALGEDMPCFLDRASPTKQDFPEGHRYAARTFDFAKNFWALRFAELGYTSLYLDTDVIVLKDPFRHYQASYDIQGLSDYRAASSPELPQLGEMLTRRCELYRQKRGNELEGGDVVHPTFELQGEELAQSMRALTPCMSLGLWFLRPTRRSLQFLRYVVRWIVDTHQRQWDQAAWNEVLMGFLVGMGDEAPLQLRLLPLSNFANIEVWEARKQQQLAVDPVILHAGYLAGYKKAEKMMELGLWKPDDIDHAAAARHLEQLNGTLQRPARALFAGRLQQGGQGEGTLPGRAARVALAAAIVLAAPAALLLLAMRRRRPPSKLF